MGAIYVTNTNSSEIAASNYIPVTVTRKLGNSMAVINNGILLRRPGYYKIAATVTFTALDAGNVTISLQNNGVDIPGITATETITTAETEVRTIALEGIVRVFCHQDPVMLTLVNTGNIDITTSNVSLSVID